MCTTQISLQGDLLFQENWEPPTHIPSDSPLLTLRVYFLQAAARQWLSMSGLLKMGHLPNMSLLSWETILRISPSTFSEQFYNLHLLISSSSFPLHSHRCQTHVILWRLFPPGMSPLSLTLVGIYPINLMCLIKSWYLLLRWCEQKVLLLRMVQEKEQRDQLGTGGSLAAWLSWRT